MKKTFEQLLENLTWYNLIEKLKELFEAFWSRSISNIQAGENISIEGEGTEENPLVINSTSSSTGNYIPLSGGENINGEFKVDDYSIWGYFNEENKFNGFITSYDSGAGMITNVLPDGTGIDATSVNLTLLNNFYTSGEPIPGLEIQTTYANELSEENLGSGLFSNYDYSGVLPDNKLIYAQRSYIDNKLENFIPNTGTPDGEPVTGNLIGSEYFDKQGNPNAFAQMQDVLNAIEALRQELTTP